MATQNGTKTQTAQATATTRSASSASKTKSQPPAAAQPVTAVKKFSGWLKTNYGYTPLRAKQQEAVQAYYALKEGLGLACQTRLTSANASTPKFWGDWNNGGFSDLVGQPTKSRSASKKWLNLQ